MQGVAIKALLRGCRFEWACERTAPTVQRGWEEERLGARWRQTTADEWLADKLDLRIVTESRGRTVDGHERRVVEHTLMLSPWLTKTPGRTPHLRSRLFEAVSLAIEFTGNIVNWQPVVEQDEVIETVLDEGRTVFSHSWMSRVLQHMVLDAVTPGADQIMIEGSHAYRPGRSRFTALASARTWARRGYLFSCDLDVRHFFDGLMIDAVDFALRKELPWMRERLRHFVLSFLVVLILRRPSHPGRRAGTASAWSRPKGHVLQGAPISPFLSNIVATHFLDKPFIEIFGDKVIFLRYSDNVLLLARDPRLLDTAVKVIELFLGVLHLELHPDKGHREPVDLRREPLPWLGKLMHGGSVLTPTEKIDSMIQSLLATSAASADFKSGSFRLLDELALDPQSRQAGARRVIERESGLHGASLDQVAEDWRRRRNFEPARDPEPDLLVHEQTARVAEKGVAA